MLYYRRFIGGPTIHSAINRCNTQKWYPILDFAKEASKTHTEVSKTTNRMRDDLEAITDKNTLYALKTSSFLAHPKAFILMNNIITQANNRNIKILVDAEDDTLYTTEQKYIARLAKIHNTKQANVYKTYQMYRKDALELLYNDLKQPHFKGFKLVRGAYLQQDKSKGVLHNDKLQVDVAYDIGLEMVIDNMKIRDDVELLVATHNAVSVEKAMMQAHDYKNRIAFAQLMGMSDKLTQYIIDNNYRAYKYVPYGSLHESLPYLMRRLYENKNLLNYVFSIHSDILGI